MHNRFLNYLLSDNPNKVISKYGLMIRKSISPLYRNIMMLFTKGKLVEIDSKDNEIKEDKVIYACTHSFHDDIVFSMKLAGRHTYLLYGNLKDFYETFHGIGLWVNGVILLDRNNLFSRKSSIKKMIYTIENGGNIIMFPEGTWNLDENLPILDLHLGIYDVAKKTNAKVIPIATYQDNNITYAKRGKEIDITKIDEDTYNYIIDRQLKLINKCIDLLIYNTDIEISIKEYLLLMINILEEEKDIDKVELYADILRNKVIDYMNKIEINSCLYSIISRIEKILGLILKMKKIVCVGKLRDVLATMKWQLYTEIKRNDIDSNYWENYKKDLIATTNGCYNYEEEKNAIYVNPEKYNEDDVFSCLDNVKITKENARVLALTRNK